jgi:uncharacterized protein YjbI with pentapeptide repeats
MPHADLSLEIFGRARILARALRAFGLVLAGLVSIIALWFSIVVATIPGEWQETTLASLNPPVQRVDVNRDGKKDTKLITARDLLFAGEVDDATRRRKSLFSNTLVLPEFNFYEALKIDDPKKLAWKEHLFDLRARHLEQAVLDGSDLTKADLTWSYLQGASLRGVRLQGSSLEDAHLQVTILRLYLVVVELPHGKEVALPTGEVRQWTDAAYTDLQRLMKSIPEGEMRDAALKRIETLDCGKPGNALASCDPAAEQPPDVLVWQQRLEAAARVDDTDYANALATELRSLICTNDINAIHILRGLNNGERLAETGREAPALVNFIMSNDCPVSASLTSDDKAMLLEIKQKAEKESAPPPTSKKEK